MPVQEVMTLDANEAVALHGAGEGAATGLFAQGYFVSDSKESGAVTVSHLRFGPPRHRPGPALCLLSRPGSRQAGRGR